MVDLTNRTIKKIFEQQVKDLTLRTVATREDSFDYQLSGEWLQ